MNERRRDFRSPVEIPVTVKVGKKTYAATTVNVSFKGIAVRLEEALPLRQLVQLEIELPGGGGQLSGHAMVVHASQGLIGLEFFGRGVGPAWDDYVQSTGRASLQPPAGGVPPLAPPVGSTPARPITNPAMTPPHAISPPLMTPPHAMTPPGGVRPSLAGPSAAARPSQSPERRRSPRIPLRIELRLRTPRSMHPAFTTEVSMLSAGILVQGAEVAVGEPVIVNLIQPGTSFSFRRDGTIRRVAPVEGGWCHVGIEFAPLEPMREVLFADFMNTAYATLRGKGG
jgi:hypothetical protein